MAAESASAPSDPTENERSLQIETTDDGMLIGGAVEAFVDGERRQIAVAAFADDVPAREQAEVVDAVEQTVVDVLAGGRP